MKEEKNNKKKNTTNAQVKMYAYLCSLAGKPDFLESVIDIRKKFSLPNNGFNNDLDDEFAFVNKLPVCVDESGEEMDFQKAVYNLASQFDITFAWLDTIQGYVLYGDFFFTKILPLVQILDIPDILDDDSASNSFANIADSLPVGIFVSPYASGLDIIDYVKKQYKIEIKPLQSKYAVDGAKIGKVRKKNSKVQDRDDFICKHKDLPTNELASRVSAEYGMILEYTYINKIIARKCKRGK